MAIKTLYSLERLTDESMSEDEEELVMDEIELGVMQLSRMIWTPTKYKPQQVAQFISLLQNKNCKIPEAASKAHIEIDSAYKFCKQWTETGGTILSGYRLGTEIKKKGNNAKLTEEHSLFLNNYVEKHPTCIIKDATSSLCAAFEDFMISTSPRY